MSEKATNIFTAEEMDIVRQTDLPNLLTSLGYQVTTVGRFQSTKEMDSLRIKNRRTFYRYSEGVGGDAITFLRYYHDMDFEQAVSHLLEFNGHSNVRSAPIRAKPFVPAEEEKPEFHLPGRSGDNKRVFAYLMKRGISKDVISQFIKSGLLYEDEKYHNCVFVGKDAQGQAVFAYKRGTYDKNGDGFKGDVPGSDKNTAFRLPTDPAKETVGVFESPIDLMSYMTLHRNVKNNAIALCCLHDGALERYLGENPHIKRIALRLDGDQWGWRAPQSLNQFQS